MGWHNRRGTSSPGVRRDVRATVDELPGLLVSNEDDAARTADRKLFPEGLLFTEAEIPGTRRRVWRIHGAAGIRSIWRRDRDIRFRGAGVRPAAPENRGSGPRRVRGRIELGQGHPASRGEGPPGGRGADPLTSLADDVAATKRVLAAQPGPVVLVGHSWAGTVITEAGGTVRKTGVPEGSRRTVSRSVGEPTFELPDRL
jgi:hypothetical protein